MLLVPSCKFPKSTRWMVPENGSNLENSHSWISSHSGRCCDKNNKPSLIKKKKHKNKRELKTETRNDPTMMHIYTQTNIHEHWSRRPIRRGVPIGDDRQAPDWRRYDREESQRWTHIHTQTQDHTEQTAECCHRGITTNRHMIYLETSNRIHPVQGGFHPSLHPIPIFFLSSPRVVDRGSYT